MKAINPTRDETSEEGYYSDGNVWVTSRRLIYAGGSHELRSVRGVQVRIGTAGDRLRNQVISLSVYMVVFVLLFFSTNQNIALQVMSICGLVLLPGAFILMVLKRNKMPHEVVYSVSVRYKFWSATVAASMDQEYIERILEVIQYALARRDGTAYTVAAPASVGHSFKIPSPIIRGTALYVNQTPYDMATIRSAFVTKYNRIEPKEILWGLVLAPQLLFGYGNQSEGILGAIVPIGLLLVYCCLLAVMFAPESRWPGIHLVELTPRTGRRAIVFASTSKDDATQVRQAINESRKTQPVPQPQ
jgi:hypothetical protein